MVGASVSGLASAACLQKPGINCTVIVKQAQLAAPCRNHYVRLQLPTPKSLSNLSYKKLGSAVPRYPARQQVVNYLNDYQKAFNIYPVFNTEAISIQKEADHWVCKTTKGTFQSKYLVGATGSFGKPKPFRSKGMETFMGKILHSYRYKTGRNFKGKKVLIVGFGNPAGRIALDLYEQGAAPAMAVRLLVNIIPRDFTGIPILQLSLLMSRLPPRLADAINAPKMRLLYGDITTLGLKKIPYGTIEQIKKDGSIPLLDFATIKHIRAGHIGVVFSSIILPALPFILPIVKKKILRPLLLPLVITAIMPK